MEERGIKLFVPGRVCLFGEHSDWAGGHRRQNPNIEKGYTIVAPTNQGNYATVRRLNVPVFKFNSKCLEKELTIDLDEKKLLKVAEEGGLFSYVSGVAHEIISSYNQIRGRGMEIENYKTDLPIKKGLSSSASICVLIARAFNEIYNLGFTDKRIMELAYLGETTTPSRCGKMDQACAFNNPVLMTFDGDKINVEKLEIGKDLYFLIVDLKKKKDTVKILADLNQGFPWPKNPFEEEKHKYFELNKQIVMKAKEALISGDVSVIGSIMNFAQKNFDKYLTPSSPEELKAPILHSVLLMPEIQKFIYGGKGIGSGGDGSVQIICKSQKDREEVKKILESKGFGCLDLDLKKTSIVK
jgi:mevalonate kinase